jgi:hypothetical protein
MKLSEKSNILLERYLLAVERRLPLQGRKDILAEIRSNLMDLLEDQYPPETVLDETQMEQELRKLGSPHSVAAGYRQSDALIDPRFNPVFRFFVTFVAPIVAGAMLLAGIVSFVLSQGESPFWGIWEMFSNIWGALVGLIGSFALILILITRFFPQLGQGKDLDFMKEEQKEWSISDLPERVQETDKVHPWEPIAGIFFGIIGLLIFTVFFEDLAGFWWLVDGNWNMVPIFTASFMTFLPWIAINISLDICRNALILFQHQYTLLTRVFEIVILSSELALAAAMLRAGDLINFDKTLALQRGLPAEAVKGIQVMLDMNFVHWFLVFLIVVISLSLLSCIVRLIKSIIKNRV